MQIIFVGHDAVQQLNPENKQATKKINQRQQQKGKGTWRHDCMC